MKKGEGSAAVPGVRLAGPLGRGDGADGGEVLVAPWDRRFEGPRGGGKAPPPPQGHFHHSLRTVLCAPFMAVDF